MCARETVLVAMYGSKDEWSHLWWRLEATQTDVSMLLKTLSHAQTMSTLNADKLKRRGKTKTKKTQPFFSQGVRSHYHFLFFG